MRDPKPRTLWRILIAVTLLFWIALASCLRPAEASAPPMPLRETSGGSVAEFAERIKRYDGPRRELLGGCVSACIMWLAKGCVITSGDNQTWLLFHGPSWGGEPMNRVDFDHWSQIIASHYPPQIAAWYLETGRFGFHQMSGARAVSLGAEECE